MNVALFSIKPCFVDEIFSGRKKFEFRKKKMSKKIDTIVIYATFPVCRIVGEVTVSEVLQGSPDNIWCDTQKYAGINYFEFSKYFSNNTIAFAYVLEDFCLYNTQIALRDIGINYAPQSFLYLPKETFAILHAML